MVRKRESLSKAPLIHLKLLSSLAAISFSTRLHLINGVNGQASTGNDRYSGDRYSGIDRFSGNDGFSVTKNPDDAILFTVSGITAIVELFFELFQKKPSYFQK